MAVDARPTAESAKAVVVVPFVDVDEAEQWAEKIANAYPEQPRVIVTEGTREITLDPESGERTTVLTFAGGWRARVAGGGSVTIVRSDDLEDHHA